MSSPRQLLTRFFVAALALALIAPSAKAQLEEIDETYVIVTRPNNNPALLRCFAGMIWYPVAKLDQGQILLADGKRDEFFRVGYPTGVPVVVLANDARVDDTVGVVTLTNASALHARNMAQPTSVDSYKPVLTRPLPAGTQLALVGPMTEDGTATGYYVNAPEDARAWVNSRHVRNASREEIDSFLASTRPSMPVETPEPDPGAQKPMETPAETETISPAPTKPETTTAMQPADEPATAEPGPSEETETPTIEMKPAPQEQGPAMPKQEMAKPETTAQAPMEPVSEQATGQDPAANEPAKPEPTLYERLTALDEAYDTIRSQQTAIAEITPLMAEYEGVRDDATAKAEADDDETFARMAQYAQTKMDLLALRAELQRGKARLAALSERSDSAAQRLEATRQQLIRARGYEMVGVLVRSSLYTGGSLPLRYRLQSSESETARTIAYIEISDEAQVAPLIGSLVGVIPSAGGISRGGPIPIVRAEVIEKTELP